MMRLRTPFLAAALFTSVAVVGLMPALAQSTPAPANSGAAQSEARHHATQRMLPGQLVDERIAFLKAELKITPAQETQWQQVAGAMHENANSLDQAIKTARQTGAVGSARDGRPRPDPWEFKVNARTLASGDVRGRF
jgi:protein CpxP